MKRTFWEFAGAASMMLALGLFQHELVSLRAEHRERLARAEAQLALRPAPADLREQAASQASATLLASLDERLSPLEQRQRETDALRDAAALEQQMTAARRDAADREQRLAADVDATRSRVAAQESALRDIERQAREADARSRALADRLADRLPPDKTVLTGDLLLPTVQLEGGDTVGAGTLVRSSRNPDSGEVENYVLTAWHVCRNIFADTPNARRDGIVINAYVSADQALRLRGDLVVYDASIDTALVRLRSDRVFDHVARVATPAAAAAVTVWDDVLAVGCPLGSDPIATRGAITNTHNVLRGTNYWMINAPTYYGNSGGGVFLDESRALIGVFSKIYTHGVGTPVVVPHMGLCTPISTIRDWLSGQDLGHVLQAQTSTETDAANLAAPAK